MLSDSSKWIINQTLADLFKQDVQRNRHYCLAAAGLHLDYSRNHINESVLKSLFELAQAKELPQKRLAMFHGDLINTTEERAVLHTALRQETDDSIYVHHEDVIPRIRQEQRRMAKIVEALHQKEWVGFSGKPISDVVNIGIGGSDVGPRMVIEALEPYHSGLIRCHFVANVDGAEIATVLKKLNPETTLFIVASKSFSTQETLINALTAKRWIVNAAGDSSAVAKHFIAISSQLDKVEAFGINKKNCLQLWDFVGGRYSLWSAIGLPIAIMIGMEHFMALLSGAEAMDQHFLNAPLKENMPVILALIGILYRNAYHTTSQAIVPYDERLSLLPAYLQQVDMESNGKSMKFDSRAVGVRTNKRTNERTNKQTNERTNERTNKQTNERTNERTNKQTKKRTNKLTN